MNPYYQDDFVTLYHGDCLEHPEWWTNADVLVTDPPYGIAWDRPEIKSVKNPWYNPGIQGDKTPEVRDAALDLWGAEKPGVVFGSMKEPVSPSRMILIFRKPKQTHAGMFGAFLPWRKDWEPIFVIGKSWPKTPSNASGVIETAWKSAGGYRGYTTETGHPHTKPLDVMEQLITACPPGVIADPFAGSGSTLVAAKRLGRKAVGVELEEKYCEIAARRLSQGVLDLWEVGA